MWYDVFVLAVLIVGMVRGAVRGVVWQLAGIAGIVLCLVFAETISAIGSPLVSLEPPLNQWVVMFVAYLFFSFLSFGFARLINNALEKAELKEYNKHLGAIFGVVKGAVVCLVITFFLVTLSATTRSMLQSSRSARYAAIVMDRLHPVMPEKLRGALDRYIHDLDAKDLPLQYADGDGNHHHGDSDEPAGDPQVWVPSDSNGAPANDGSSWDWNGSPFDTGSTNTPNGSSQPTSPMPSDTIDQMLSRIPGLSNEYVRDTVRELYEATPQSSRQQLVQDLKDAGPNFVFSVLQRWRSQTPQPAPTKPAETNSGWSPNTGPTQNVGYTQPPVPTRESLIASIATRLARSPQDQPAHEQNIGRALEGLPDAVKLDVLKDWQADLAGDTDPDSTTNVSTPLDQRIIRQLTVHRVSVFQLSDALRDRLMSNRQQ